MTKLTVFGLMLACFAEAGASSQIQIKKFRFHSHHALNFERLVIEFADRGGDGNARVRLAPTGNGKETVVGIEKVGLVGAIPESAINEAYSKESRYFGPIAINNDNPSAGFTIRTFVKDPHAMVDAFWLKSPSRLILDVYPKTSPRAQGPEVLASYVPSRHTASHGGHSRRVASKKGNVVCFFTNSQVVASLAFEPGSHPRNLAMAVDDSNAVSPEGGVICYPSSAQAQPKIAFNIGNQTQHVTMDFGQRPISSLPISPLPFTPQTHQSTPVFQNKTLSRDEKLNRDADMALGGDEDDGRGLASPGLFSGVDNFNKNNPPPTLGKQLAPPGFGGSQSKSPQLANPAPGGLLPPLR